MQFRITGIDLDAMALVVSCPGFKAQPGQPCDFKASRDWATAMTDGSPKRSSPRRDFNHASYS